MGINSTEVAYGFGQLGSVHGEIATPLIPPKGMVIIAIQFLADNILEKLVSESQGTNGTGANFIDTETEAKWNFEGVTASQDSTMGAETVAAGDDITITANSKVNVGQYVLLVADAGTSAAGLVVDASTAVPNYARGFEAGTKVVSVNAAGTTITLDESITFDNSQHLIFIDEHNGAGGQDASGIKYPKGLTIYGRWKAVTPEADTDGGVICYFGK